MQGPKIEWALNRDGEELYEIAFKKLDRDEVGAILALVGELQRQRDALATQLSFNAATRP